VHGLKVLVVGINYAPEHTGIAPYTTAACEHLLAQGADLYVLAGLPHYPHWSVPTEYAGVMHVDEIRQEVPVRRLRHMVPTKQNVLSRSLYELTFGAHLMIQRLPWRPDVVLAVIPSLAGAAVAATIAKRHDARLVLWVQDLVGPATAQSGIIGGSRISRATVALENTLLRRADRILMISSAFRDYAVAAGVNRDRVTVVPNWSHVDAPSADRAVTRRRLGWGEEEVIALHSGNMGLKQGLDNVVDAANLAVTRAPRLRFVLMGDGSQRDALAAASVDLPTLSMLPPATEADFPNVLAAADVLLVNERASVLDMSLPSKLTSYFRAGTPVIAAVPGLGGTAQEVERTGAGLVVRPEDAEHLLEGILGLIENAAMLTALRKAALREASGPLDAGRSLSKLFDALKA
jgi:colanic acid biosynthesis glycosyl transferase WcaI